MHVCMTRWLLTGDGNGPGAYRARVPMSEANLLRSKFSQSTRFHGGHHDDKSTQFIDMDIYIDYYMNNT